MPAIADITVKKNDGTTNITYSAQSPSSGDGVPAIWRSTSVGTAAAHQPEFRLSSREAQKGAKRALRSTFQYPQIATNSTTGLTSVVDRASFDTNVVLSKGMTASDINEACAQYANLLASALIQQCLKAGFSAT